MKIKKILLISISVLLLFATGCKSEPPVFISETPDPITNFRAITCDKKVILKWSNPTCLDFSSLQIFAGTEQLNLENIASLKVSEAKACTYTITELTGEALKNNTAYYFMLNACFDDEEKTELKTEVISATPIDIRFADAQEIVGNMVFGWNLGNTLDANTETGWGQPKTTKAMIDGLVAAGINTIRIPVSWSNHLKNNSTCEIDPVFMARVKEIVDYCIDDNMYVILNSHHDNAENENFTIGFGSGYYPSPAGKANSEKFLSAVWKQIAEEFIDYDENLIFETLNEPRLKNTSYEWWYNPSDKTCQNAMKTLNGFNQLIVDTIRETGGKNSERCIAIPSLGCSPDSSLANDFKLPSDSAENKLIAAVHMYTPYSFAMESPGETSFTNSHKNELDKMFSRLNQKFVSKGIPVYVGEMGATNKNNLEDRKAWFSYFVSGAKKYDICSILWDNGTWKVIGTDYSEHYGYYCRTKAEWYFPSLIEEAVTAAGGSYSSIPAYSEK